MIIEYFFDVEAFEAAERTDTSNATRLGQSLYWWDGAIPCTTVKRVGTEYGYNGDTVYQAYNKLRRKNKKVYIGEPCPVCKKCLRRGIDAICLNCSEPPKPEKVSDPARLEALKAKYRRWASGQ